MKRNLNVRVSFFLIILMILMGMPTAAFAGSISNLNVEPIAGSDVTKDIQMTVQITNDDATVEEGDIIDPTKDMTMRVDFTIPDSLTLKTGDYMQVELPEYLKFSTLQETEIYMTVDDEKVLLGNVTVSGNKAILTFADSAQNEEFLGRGGWFSAGLSFDITKIETSEDKVVVIILGNDFTILVKDTDKGVISLKKSGTADISKSEEVTWTITATPSKEDKKFDGYVLKDTLPANTTYVEASFEIKPSTLNKDNLKIDSVQGTIEYTFDKDVTGAQTITYKTKIKDVAANNNKEMTITNNVSLTDSETTTSAAATVKVKPQLISKTGNYVVTGHAIDWTIKVNSSKATLKNVVVTDVLANEMTLDTIKIGNKILTQDSSQKPYYNQDGKTIKIYLGDLDKQVSILLNTKLDNTVKASVQNKATLTWEDTGSTISGGNQGTSDIGIETIKDITITDGFIYKTAGKYDIRANEMPWSIDINKANKKIENVTVVELFAYNKDEVSKINSAPNTSKFEKYKGKAVNINQKYLTGTLTLDTCETEKIADDATFTQKGQYKVKTVQLNSTIEAQIVEVYLGNIENTEKVTLKTKVTDKKAYGENGKSKAAYTIKNTAYLYYGDGSTPLSDYATKQHYSCILDKDCAVGYNYVDHTITWRLYVNHNSLEFENGVITDTLPKYWDVDGNDFYEIYKGGAVNLGSGTATIQKDNKLSEDEVKALVKGIEITEKDNVKTIQFEFNKISDKYVILIKTKLPDQAAMDNQFSVNGEVTVRNNASMTGDSISGSQGDWEDVTIKNSLVFKTGALDKDSNGKYTGDATWTIDVNRNAIHLPTDELSKVYVIDKLQNYLEPKMENGNYKIRVWEMELKANGSWEKADEVSQETVQSGITYKDKELRIKLPKTDGSYRIELVTRLTSDTVTQINNLASLEGVKTDIVSNNETIKIEYADGVAWANLAGKIILTKTAEKTGAVLEGAVFELYELSDDSKPVETLKYTKVTDNKGMIQFGRLKFGKYKLVEVTAPIGYEIDKNSASRIIELDTSESDTRIVNLNITNKRILRAIQLLKTDELGNALAGAEFTLYKTAIANENVIAKSQSAVNGAVTFNNVKMGEYYIAETKVPTGYSSSTTSAIIKAVVDKDGKVSYFAGENFANAVTDVPTIKNEAYKGNVIISKVDKAGSPLKGAEFTLYDENQNVVAKAVSEGDRGIAKFENLRFGNYTIKETAAPSGYIASDKLINITEEDFAKNNVELAYIVENEKSSDGGGSNGGNGGNGGSHSNPNNPKPQEDIPDEAVPLTNVTENSKKADPAIIENPQTPLGEVPIEDDNVPLGKLPATGGIGQEIYFGFGAGLVALGAGLRRKLNKNKV